MKKVKKITNTNTDNNTLAKTTSKTNSQWEEYLSTYSLQMQPAADGFKERLFLELLKWVRENEEALTIEEFIVDIKGIYESDYYRWLAEDERWRKAHNSAISTLGRRREKGAIYRKMDAKTIHFTLPYYSKIWAEQQERNAKLGIQDNDSKEIKVILESFQEPLNIEERKEAHAKLEAMD